MTLSAGTRLGPYEIQTPLGAGGMGEVYRARDTRLDRVVALKVLATGLTTDTERLRRFEQEARAAAALNHPNILAVYDIGQHDGTPFIVSELLEGESLRDRLSSGPIPVRKAIEYAIQIALGLSAAHEKAIVHRDLKPENIFITSDGRVKILDFGLAKLTQPERGVAGISTLPTTPPNTQAGVVLGTIGYMSPEQVRGLAADQRSDIFSFGAVLFEMMSGQRAFRRDTGVETMTAILREDAPELGASDPNISPALKKIINRCLEKNPAARFHSADDLAFSLEALTSVSGISAQRADSTPPKRFPRPWIAVAAVALVAASVAATYAVSRRSRESIPSLPVLLVSLPIPSDQPSNSGRHYLAISPDGGTLVYAANRQLVVRPLNQLDWVPLRGTEGATEPFFSPDGKWIAFWQSGQLKKVLAVGGAPVVLCVLSNPCGATWPSQDEMYVGQCADGIVKVPASGGVPQVIVKVDATESAHQPQLLPDGRTLLFTLSSHGNNWTNPKIVTRSLSDGSVQTIVDKATDARYVPPGTLLYVQGHTLLAAPFDSRTNRIVGGAIPLVENVTRGTLSGSSGAAQFSASNNGSLVYLRGSMERRTLVWVDRQGREEPIAAEPHGYGILKLSPDGRKVALDVRDDDSNIWIWEFGRANLVRFTLGTDLSNIYPVWTPDGRQIVFSSDERGQPNAYIQAADGTGSPRRISASVYPQFSYGFTPDGRTLIFAQGAPGQGAAGGRRELRLLQTSSDQESSPLLKSGFDERNAALSADGKWIAYQSDKSGRFEIYVRPFPKVNEGLWQVSVGGGETPVWRHDGRELYYASAGNVMAISIRTEPEFSAGKPQKLFGGAYFFGAVGRAFDVTPDGQRFLMIKPTDPSLRPTSFVFVQNWLQELNLVGHVKSQ